MTRAKKELHILSMKTNQINSLSYSGLFLSYCENLKSNHKGEFEWGKNEINKDFKEDFTQNFSLDINSNLNWKNKIYFDLNKNNSENKRTKGLIYHELLSQINSVNEIDFILNNYREKKMFSNLNIKILRSKIIEILNHKNLKELFSNQYKILNEKEILNPSGKILRPDKIIFTKNKTVIIDFKTGKLREKDTVQLKEYEVALKKMNYKNIQKILVYVNDSIDVIIV